MNHMPTPIAARIPSAALACSCFDRTDAVSVWAGMFVSLLLHGPGGARLPS